MSARIEEKQKRVDIRKVKTINYNDLSCCVSGPDTRTTRYFLIPRTSSLKRLQRGGGKVELN